jgi:hypothetical protein
MEIEDEWTHYCDDPRTKQYVFCTIKDLKEIQSRRFTIPYDSIFLFDTVQLKNIIYFAGGGCPAADSSPEQFYQIVMRVNTSMEMIVDKMANMITARANHAMAAGTKKLLYVVGGTNNSGLLSSCEEYNIDSNKWKEVAQLNEKKKWISLCSLKEKCLYAFGGAIEGSEKATDAIECLDLTKTASKFWEKIKIVSGNELWNRRFFAGAMSVNGKNSILLFGGVVKEAEKDDCLEFDPTGKTIKKLGNLLRSDAFYRTKPGVKSTKIVIVGSHDGDLHIYDKATQKWDLQMKKIWNPEHGFAYKSDTF